MSTEQGQPQDVAPVPPPALPDERMQMLQINGLRLACRQWGRGDAAPMVLLHGLRGFSGTWRALAAALSDDHRLIALDQRGRGESDWDPGHNYYTDAYLSDLESLVDQLGLDRFVLLGHSMGGTTAYVYAATHPHRVKALIIEDIAPGASASGAGARRIVSEMTSLPESFSSWAQARAYWHTQRPSLSSAAVEQRLAESMRRSKHGEIVWRYDAAGIRQTRVQPDPARVVDLWPVVDRLTVPTLIIRGERSDMCPPETVAAICDRNAHVRAVTVSNAGHYVHDDAPEVFARQVRDFLGGLH